jgi:hypothetical protein
MTIFSSIEICPKCDSELKNQHDGSVKTIDIAHNKETLEEALTKLSKAIKESQTKSHQFIRAIVGSKLIKEETLKELSALKKRGTIIEFREDSGNRGALIIKMKS